MLRALALCSLLAACRPDPTPVPVQPAPVVADAAPPAVAVDAAAPWEPPTLSLEPVTTEGPKGDTPALAIVARGFPALAADGSTFVAFDAMDHNGHNRDTRLVFVDPRTRSITTVPLAGRGDQVSGSMDPEALRPALTKAVRARLAKANERLHAITWAKERAQSFFASRGHDGPSADWEIVPTTPEVDAAARWTETGALRDVRVRIGGQPLFEGLPTWSTSKPPRCGYEGVKRTPDETVAVLLVTDRFVVLGRDWSVGTHDCDGVEATSSFAFLAR